MDEMEKEMMLCFIEEGRQLLEEAEQCFLDLEADRTSISTLEKLFRIAHNIKGTSRAVGFSQVAEFTHEFENLLLELKEGRRVVDQPCVDIMLECNDAVKAMIDALSQNLEAKFDNDALIQKLKSYMSGEAQETTSQPELSELSADNDRSFNEVVDAAQWAPIEAPEPDATVVASTEKTAPIVPEKTAAAATGAKDQAAGPDESIRVSLKRLEKLSDYIGELVILQTVLDQHGVEVQSPLVSRTISQLAKLSKEIQDISLSLRMIPLKQTFAKLQRIVRDTGRALNKDIDLILEGEATEVDKTVLENLSDPLVHIVRNAIDHGLETTEGRVAAGKDSRGRVEIKAFHKGNNLVIEVRDDGKGIDPLKLKSKAIAKGLIRADSNLTDDECIQLIFKNGFSTKDEVSEISGRGVGLDVVKTNVEKMGGQVQLESKFGFGSTFRITLPLTLAIIEGLICEVSKEKFVIPMANVREIVRAKPGDLKVGSGGGTIMNLRGKVLPIFSLSRSLGVQPTELNGVTSQSVILIAESRAGDFGVTIDEIIRQQQIVIKKLGRELAGRKGFVGSAILGDGKPALIIDLNDVIESPVRTSHLRAA